MGAPKKGAIQKTGRAEKAEIEVYSRPMSWISLKFQGALASAQLDETEFFSPLVARRLRCRRGQQAGAEKIEGAFPWTAGVMGMCAVFIKARQGSLRNHPDYSAAFDPSISSDTCAWAKPFDSSLAKRPRWVLDMFGVDSAGTPLVRRMFVRRNPEARRPGPVAIRLNEAFLAPTEIKILLNGEEVRDADALQALLDQMQAATGEINDQRTEAAAEPERRGLLLPFLDHFILSLSGFGTAPRRDALIEEECRTALRLALISSDVVYVPAVSYIQSPVCRRLLDEHRSHAQLGAIRLLTDAPTWREFFEARRGEYSKDSGEYWLYSSAPDESQAYEFPVYATGVDTTRALHQEWRASAASESFQGSFLDRALRERADAEERRALLSFAADELGPRAFIAKHLVGTFRRHNAEVQEDNLTSAICGLFFSHFRSAAALDVLDDLAYVQGVPVRGPHRRIRFGRIIRQMRAQMPEVLSEMCSCSSEALWGLKGATEGIWG